MTNDERWEATFEKLEEVAQLYPDSIGELVFRIHDMSIDLFPLPSDDRHVSGGNGVFCIGEARPFASVVYFLDWDAAPFVRDCTDCKRMIVSMDAPLSLLGYAVKVGLQIADTERCAECSAKRLASAEAASAEEVAECMLPRA